MQEYIENAFTREGENTNLEINNLNVGCITSKNGKFELDSNGNLTINSLTVKDMRIATQLVLDVMYPVGSIYISVTDVNPSAHFGGEWEKIEDKFLLGSGNGFELGTTGGEEKHKLTVDEMPSHYHDFSTPGRVLYWDAGLPSYGGLAAGNTIQYTWGAKTKTVGNGKEHNNMPPYLVVNVWKRIG